MNTPEGNELESVAQYSIETLPDGRFTLQNFLPVLTMLVEHADHMQHMSGLEKKALVLRAMETAANKLPPPENVIACMLVQKLGPAAVDSLVTVGRQAQTRLQDSRLFSNRPLIMQPSKRPPGRFVMPWRRAIKGPQAIASRPMLSGVKLYVCC